MGNGPIGGDGLRSLRGGQWGIGELGDVAGGQKELKALSVGGPPIQSTPTPNSVRHLGVPPVVGSGASVERSSSAAEGLKTRLVRPVRRL